MANNDPFNLTSFALSLLLVFRTNTSYARWWDARVTWGAVLSGSRDLIRQARNPPHARVHPHPAMKLCPTTESTPADKQSLSWPPYRFF